MKIFSLAMTGMLLSLSACSANLVVQGVKDPTVFNGIRVYTPANFIVTHEIRTEIRSERCPNKYTVTIEQLPVGDPYDIKIETGWFAGSQFHLMLTDTGLLKEVTLNSTHQLAENLTAMATLAKAMSEAVRPVPPSIAREECGNVVSDTIVKVEKFRLFP